MEEDFDAENLEDGELWLPSDFFSMDDVQASTNFNSPLNYYSTSKPRCMEDLAQRFSDFNVRQRPNISKSLQVRYAKLKYTCNHLSVFEFFKLFCFVGCRGLNRISTGPRCRDQLRALDVVAADGPVLHRFIRISF